MEMLKDKRTVLKKPTHQNIPAVKYHGSTRNLGSWLIVLGLQFFNQTWNSNKMKICFPNFFFLKQKLVFRPLAYLYK